MENNELSDRVLVLESQLSDLASACAYINDAFACVIDALESLGLKESERDTKIDYLMTTIDRLKLTLGKNEVLN